MTGDLSQVPELVNQVRARLTDAEQAVKDGQYDVALDAFRHAESITRWTRYVIEARR